MQRRTLEEITGILNDQSASGVSVQEYCSRNALKYGTFLSWKRRVENTSNPSNLTTPFVHVRCIPSIPSFELQKGALLVKVFSGFQKSDLKDLLDVL
jgi:hypothetical protein